MLNQGESKDKLELLIYVEGEVEVMEMTEGEVQTADSVNEDEEGILHLQQALQEIKLGSYALFYYFPLPPKVDVGYVFNPVCL